MNQRQGKESRRGMSDQAGVRKKMIVVIGTLPSSVFAFASKYAAGWRQSVYDLMGKDPFNVGGRRLKHRSRPLNGDSCSKQKRKSKDEDRR
jgi:hypothetical protein